MKRKRISVYTPGWPMRAFILTILLIAAGIHVIGLRAFVPSGDVPLGMIPFVLLMDAFFVWWGVIFATQSKVTLYDDGIELQRGTSKLFTSWENTSHFEVRHSGRNRVSGIHLHEKIESENGGFIDNLFFGRKTNFLPIGHYTRVPMTWNIINNQVNQEKLLRTEFGKEIHELAPHLFDIQDDWKPKNTLQDDVTDEEYDSWVEDDRLQDFH